MDDAKLHQFIGQMLSDLGGAASGKSRWAVGFGMGTAEA
jgi:hypothetical protein